MSRKDDPASDAARIGWAFLSQVRLPLLLTFTFEPNSDSLATWRQYYSFLNKDPSKLHCFYTKRSTLIHSTEGEESQACYGQQVASPFLFCLIPTSTFPPPC